MISCPSIFRTASSTKLDVLLLHAVKDMTAINSGTKNFFILSGLLSFDLYSFIIPGNSSVFNVFGGFCRGENHRNSQKNLGFSIAFAYGGKEVLRHADFALFEVNGHGNMAAHKTLAGTDVTNENGEKTMEIYGI